MTGIVGKKVGMSRVFNQEDGKVTPVTLVKVYDACISEVLDHDGKDFKTVIVSFDETKKADKVNKSNRVAFEKKGLPLYRKQTSFKVAKSEECKTGDKITVEKVKEGDIIHVTGTSVGKGFAGAMKRHGFAGLRATHGVSISHRSHGSTGQCQDPGRVFKGKKMAGQMGNKQVTVKNLQVVMVDAEKNLICVKGSIPGSKGKDVVIRFF